MAIVYMRISECEHTGDLQPALDLVGKKVFGRILDYGINLEAEIGWIKIETEESVNDIASLIIANEDLYGFAHCTTHKPDFAR